MAEFKAINTQEELDAVIRDRLERQDKKVREEFKGWTSPENLTSLTEKHAEEIKALKEAHAKELEKYAGYDEKFAAQEQKIHGLEISALKTKIANEKKLPFDAVEFLQGEDAESIAESADKLSKLSGSTTRGFTRDTEEPEGTAKDRQWRELSASLPNHKQ